MKAFNICILCCSYSLFALPTGGRVSRGEAVCSFSSDTLQIQADGKAILQWDGFDIAPHERVRFIQSEETSAILNRVESTKASEILGSIHSNCPVYLINPQGIFIGSNAVVDTAGFIASTADLSNDCFWEQGPSFFEAIGAGSIVNLGKIRAEGGDICLIARSIDNEGEITAKNGLALLTTSEIMLNPATKQTFFIRETTEFGIQNSGTIAALAVELKTQSPYEKAIRSQGLIEAAAVSQERGRIFLVAEKGGCFLDGPLIAQEGSIEMVAEAVHLSAKASLDVSSGIISIEQVERLSVDRGASLLANGKEEGNGGVISLAAEKDLNFYGKAEVCGGARSGDGGVIHLSSKGSWLADPELKASSPNGRSGTVIFDPKMITISSEGMDPATGNTFASDSSGSVTISGDALQTALDAANVVLQANSDIVFQDTVTASTEGNSLTLQAGRSILMNGHLTLNAGDFFASINDSDAIPSERDTGISVFNLADSTAISTQGGNITLDVGTFGGVQEGEMVFYGNLDAGSGNIAITGVARKDGSDNAFGVYVGSGAILQTAGSGTLTLNGTGGSGTNTNAGINLSGGMLQTDAGLLEITGVGGGNGLGIGCVGIYLAGEVSSLSTGSISFHGTGGDGVHGNMGIFLSQGSVRTVDGSITMDGTGSGSGAMNFGIRLEGGAQCIATGSGTISLSGSSGLGKNNNHGVILSSGVLSANTGEILIAGIGQGSINYNYGIRLEGDSQCISTGTAPISLYGQSVTCVNSCMGVIISTLNAAITSSYGDIEITGSSAGTGFLNQGIRLETGQIISTGTGLGAAAIHLIGVGSPGTDFCNGVAILGEGQITPTLSGTVITSIDGNIVLEATAQGSGQGNQPFDIDSSSFLQTTGLGTLTYIEH